MSFWKRTATRPAAVISPKSYDWPHLESKHQFIRVPLDYSRHEISPGRESFLVQGFCDHPSEMSIRVAATFETNEHVGPWSTEKPWQGTSTFPETETDRNPLWGFTLYCDPQMLKQLPQVMSRVSDPKARVQLTLHVDSPTPVRNDFWKNDWRRALLRVYWDMSVSSRFNKNEFPLG